MLKAGQTARATCWPMAAIPLPLLALCLPPAPRCMLPPCPWRGQDIERRSTVYTFQNGQPCRVMGESDRVTRQARILPRVLKGDIP